MADTQYGSDTSAT